MVAFHALLNKLIHGGKTVPRDTDRCLGNSYDPNTLKKAGPLPPIT